MVSGHLKEEPTMNEDGLKWHLKVWRMSSVTWISIVIKKKKIQRTNLNCSFHSNRLLQLQFELQ